MAHVRQSRPDSGRGFRAEVLKTMEVVPSSPGRGMAGGTQSGHDPRRSGYELVGWAPAQRSTLPGELTFGCGVARKAWPGDGRTLWASGLRL